MESSGGRRTRMLRVKLLQCVRRRQRAAVHFHATIHQGRALVASVDLQDLEARIRELVERGSTRGGA